MSIFSNKGFDSEIVACEGYDITLGGGYDLIMESYDDDLAIIEAMHAYDMAELEAMKESGSEYSVTPVMEASLKETWAKIKEFFKKLGSRIMAFLAKAKTFVDSIVVSGTEFAKKYEARLTKLNLNGFSYEMYEYNYDSVFAKDFSVLKLDEEDAADVVSKISAVDASDPVKAESALNSISNEIEKKKESGLSGIRNSLVNDGSDEKFTENLFNKFRSGGKKKSMGINDLSKFIKRLKDSNGLLKHIANANDAVKKVFNQIEKSINDAANKAESDSKKTESAKVGARKAAVMRSTLTYFSSVKNIFIRYINAWSNAVKEATGVYKNLCFKALSYKAK